jgi:hypothetical protein
MATVRQQTDFSAGHDHRLEELAREAAAAAADSVPDLLVSPSEQLVDMSLLPDRLEFDLLADARANIADRRYELAEEQLAEYLETDPDHHEARFLRAYCLSRLGGDDKGREALRILRPLRDERTEPELRDQIRALRTTLRRRLAPREVLAYLKTAKTRPGAARARIREFLALVPEDGTLSYLLAMDLAFGGDLEQAYDTAIRGAAEADTGRDRVAALARMLSQLLVPEYAAPAVGAFRDGNLRRARVELARMDPRWRASTLLDDFDEYLRLLLDHSGQVPPPAPRLSASRAENLFSLIAESDCAQAERLLAKNRDREAELVLANALDLVPWFGWLNFLYAFCLYRLRRDPDRAAACAAIAARDPGIAQAGELLEAVRSWQEAVVINPVLDEYTTIMNSVRDGVRPGQLADLRGRLKALGQRLPALRAAARTERGTQAVAQLGDAIGARLTEIAALERESRVSSQAPSGTSSSVSSQVANLVSVLKQVMDQADPATARPVLEVLLREAERLRGLNPAARDKQLLDLLIAWIRGQL